MEDLIIQIDDKEFKAKFDKHEHSLIHINGKPYSIELLKKYGSDIFSFSVNQRLLQIEIELDKEGNLLVSYDGLSYEVAITDETKKLLAKFIKNSDAHTGNAAGIIKAPMPGLVVKILVNEGAYVEKGEKVIIVEAMKMENALKSPVAGTIKSIKIVEGQAVEKDTVMLEIKPE